jgi:hypothetical protein
MQVFIPFANPKKSAKALDSRRLNKQILESIQILSANMDYNFGWKIPKYIKNHPCTELWFYDPKYLIYYILILCSEYKNRFGRTHKVDDIMYNNFDVLMIESDNFKNDLRCINTNMIKKHQELLLSKDYNYYYNKF